MTSFNSLEVKLEPCIYSNKLLSKLTFLNKQNNNKFNLLEIKKAIFYAKKYHANQLRQTGEPYYSHPIEVAYLISDYIFRTDIIITSLLHDTLEDTKLTKSMISSIFGTSIANQVEDLTRIKEGRKISSSELVEKLWIQKKYDILLIKLFDRLHNMQTISGKSPDKGPKIVEETINDFIVLAAYLKVVDIEKEIAQLCYQYINYKLFDSDSTIPFGNDNQLLSLIFQNGSERK